MFSLFFFSFSIKKLNNPLWFWINLNVRFRCFNWNSVDFTCCIPFSCRHGKVWSISVVHYFSVSFYSKCCCFHSIANSHVVSCNRTRNITTDLCIITEIRPETVDKLTSGFVHQTLVHKLCPIFWFRVILACHISFCCVRICLTYYNGIRAVLITFFIYWHKKSILLKMFGKINFCNITNTFIPIQLSRACF